MMLLVARRSSLVGVTIAPHDSIRSAREPPSPTSSWDTSNERRATSNDVILLDGSSLTIDQLLAIADRGETIGLAPDAVARVRAARAVVDRKARGDEPVYGVNTGFGSFAEVKIAPEALAQLQVNLLRSHAAGIGEPLPVRTTRRSRHGTASAAAAATGARSLISMPAITPKGTKRCPSGPG